MTSDNNVANSAKNIYCVGKTLIPTFMDFKDSVYNMKSDYENKIGLIEEDVVYDPNTGSNATLYGKLNYILGELYK